MSFSKEIKKEILNNEFSSKERVIGFLCGLIYSSAEFNVQNNCVGKLSITTDLEFLCDFLKTQTKNFFGSDKISSSLSYKISTTQYYDICFDDKLAKEILLEIEMLSLKNGQLKLNENISEKITQSEEGIRGFVCGAFIGCGTSSIRLGEPNRTTTGYHIELSNKNYLLLRLVLDILAEFEILAKLTKRKNIYVLYIKEAEAVSNVLALMGASEAVLKLQNEIITRQMRNKINRQNNCFTSNYTKTLNASFKQLEAIKIIEQEIGLDSLSEDLQQVALLRLANTEQSLEELIKLSKYALTKSALNHKYNKLIKLSEKLRGNK